MSLTKGQYYILFLAIISFILLHLLFKWIDYLFDNNYIKESFQQMYNPNINESEKTSHTVDLPLTTTYSCQNFCGPTSRCAITGQQCFTDIDCPGCQPYTPPLSDSEKKMDNVIGDNAAGKLTFSSTPRYSVLTTDMGTKAKSFSSKKFAKAPNADYGINVWRDDFDEERKLFDKRYKPGQLEYMPEYPQRYSLTGEFIEEGPIASNATLS
jgi:hypothetical protein